jgi:porphyrinogen peroxidase
MPRELMPFKEVRGATHTAVATAGDLLYHIRAQSMGLIVEFEKLLLEAFGPSVTAVDDVAGFRYFDGRDLLEFVDGTGNPDGLGLPQSTIVGDEDPEHAGGSYIVIQKYLHELSAWRAQHIETQEAIIGRTKFDNVELRTPRTAGNHTRLCARSWMKQASTLSCGTTCRSPYRALDSRARISSATRATYG